MKASNILKKNGILHINLENIYDMKERKKLKLKRKCKKKYIKVGIGKIKTKKNFCPFFKCSLNFRAHALQSELNKVSISNFVKLRA